MTLRKQLSWRERFRGVAEIQMLEPKPQAPQPHGGYVALDLVQWCTSKDRVDYSRKLLADPMFNELLGVLATIRPERPKGPIDGTQAAFALGQRIGYDQVIAAILASSRFVDPEQDPVEADYGASDIDWSKR